MKKKVKVLQVIPNLGYGGAETGCYDLAHFLSEKDCKSFIVTNKGELLKFVNKNRWSVIKKPNSKRHIRFDFEFIPNSKKLKNIL